MNDNIRTNFCPGCKALADDLEAMTHARNDALTLVETLEAGIPELRVAIQRGLLASLGADTYDCTRVWHAWSYGTMGEDDFVPVLDRLDELIDCIVAEIPSNPFREALLDLREDCQTETRQGLLRKINAALGEQS